MHAIVQLLRAADEPAEEADGDWRSLLYGAQSDDDSEDDDGSLGSQPGAAADGTSIETLVSANNASFFRLHANVLQCRRASAFRMKTAFELGVVTVNWL